MGTEGPSRFETRCTLKLTYLAGDELVEDCILTLQALFKQIKQKADNKIAILLWFDNEEMELIASVSHFPKDANEFRAYFPKFYTRQGKRKRTDYIQLKFGHTERIKDIKSDIRGWMSSKECKIFPNMS